jgi:hypothetical protein
VRWQGSGSGLIEVVLGAAALVWICDGCSELIDFRFGFAGLVVVNGDAMVIEWRQR